MELGHVYISEKPEQNICRVCLATESKLYYHLLDSELQNDFHNITGILISLDDGLPQYICYICRVLLKKSIGFRNKSISTQNNLSLHRVTTNYKQNIVIRPLISFKQTDILLISIPPVAPTTEIETIDLADEDDNVIKKEDVKVSEHQVNFNDTEIFVKPEINEHLFDDNDDFGMDIKVTANTNNESVKHEVVKQLNCTKIADGKAKQKAKARTVKSKNYPNQNKGDPKMDPQSLKDYLLRWNPTNVYTEMLYKYIISKYIDRTKEFDTNIDDANEDYDLMDSDDESAPLKELIKVEDDSTEIDHMLTVQTDVEPSKKTLYEFMKERYMEKKKPTKKRRARDLVRIKSKIDGRVMQSQKYMEDLKKKYNMDIKILSKEEQIAEVKNRANTKLYENSLFQCDECFRGFQFERTYNDHMRSHDPASGNIKCEVCHHWFVNRRKFLKHQAHHKYRFICNVCGKVTKAPTYAKDHAKSHSGQNVYKCEYCFRIFRRAASRINHIRIKHGSVECEICYELMAPAGLRMHNILQHKDTFVCPSCDKVFNDADALDVHTSKSKDGVCDPDVRPCAVCGESFASESKWKSHIEEHRNDRKRRQRAKYYLSNRGEDPRPQSLPVKPRKDGDSGLDLARSLMCEMCGDMFPSHANMRYHQRIHTGERPFACTFCPKRFRLKVLLTMHINTHTGERPHKCPKCSKSFKSQTALYRHDLVHTKVRRHRCTLCDKTFQTSTSVKLHIKTVHLKMPMPPRVRNRKKRAE